MQDSGYQGTGGLYPEFRHDFSDGSKTIIPESEAEQPPRWLERSTNRSNGGSDRHGNRHDDTSYDRDYSRYYSGTDYRSQDSRSYSRHNDRYYVEGSESERDTARYSDATMEPPRPRASNNWQADGSLRRIYTEFAEQPGRVDEYPAIQDANATQELVFTRHGHTNPPAARRGFVLVETSPNPFLPRLDPIQIPPKNDSILQFPSNPRSQDITQSANHDSIEHWRSEVPLRAPDKTRSEREVGRRSDRKNQRSRSRPREDRRSRNRPRGGSRSVSRPREDRWNGSRPRGDSRSRSRSSGDSSRSRSIEGCTKGRKRRGNSGNPERKASEIERVISKRGSRDDRHTDQARNKNREGQKEKKEQEKGRRGHNDRRNPRTGEAKRSKSTNRASEDSDMEQAKGKSRERQKEKKESKWRNSKTREDKKPTSKN